MYPILSPLIPAELLRDIAVVKKTGAKRSSADTFCYCNETCELCEKFKRHISITNCVRTAYKKDKEAAEDTVVVSCHLQNLVLLPRLPGYKESIFTSRLIAFNLSFVPLGKTKSNKCSNKSAVAVCWHEGIMGRKDEDICSGYLKFLTSSLCRDAKHVKIWCDNCGGQNKCWTLYTVLVNIVKNRNGNIEQDSKAVSTEYEVCM